MFNNKNFATELKNEIVNKDKEFLVNKNINYLANIVTEKYYYPNEDIKEKHILIMEELGYNFEENCYSNDTLYCDLMNVYETIVVPQAIFYKNRGNKL